VSDAATEGSLLVEPLTEPPDVTVRPPGSKSITNRALLLAAFADGPSTIEGALDADDIDAMIGALGVLGAHLERREGVIEVTPAPATLSPGEVRIDARMSGTTSRFVLPAAALAGVPVVVDGAPSLRRRPMGPLLDALVQLGAEVQALGEPGCLPVRVGGSATAGGTVALDGSTSSQYLSALLLSGPRFVDGLRIELTGPVVARPFVDLTIAALRDFGAVAAEVAPGVYEVGPTPLVGRHYVVEPDATAATYFLAAAAITGGRVRVDGLGKGSMQGDVAFLDVLEQMGATVQRGSGWVEVVGGPLRGVDIDLSAIPDTALTLAAVAVFADTPTQVRGVGFIRGHETDRLAAVVAELRRMGLEAAETPDGFTVRPGEPRPTTIRTYDDHRMAMSFALVGLRAPGIRIADPSVTAKTYPGFFDDLERLRTAGRDAIGQ
jgi:3-phosphoshikimate 1-carboxyvinyltransferase